MKRVRAVELETTLFYVERLSYSGAIDIYAVRMHSAKKILRGCGSQ